MTHVLPFFDSKSFDTYPYMTVVDQGALLLRLFLHLRFAYKIFEFTWLPNIAWKVSVFGVILVHIFSHSDWIRRDTLEISPYLVRMRENTDQNNSYYKHFLRSVNFRIELRSNWDRNTKL